MAKNKNYNDDDFIDLMYQAWGQGLEGVDPIDDFIGADEEDINALISNYKEREKFDDGVRTLAQNDDEYSYLKGLDNY